MYTRKNEGKFLPNLCSILFGGLQSGRDVECNFNVTTALKLNVVVGY